MAVNERNQCIGNFRRTLETLGRIFRHHTADDFGELIGYVNANNFNRFRIALGMSLELLDDRVCLVW